MSAILRIDRRMTVLNNNYHEFVKEQFKENYVYLYSKLLQ